MFICNLYIKYLYTLMEDEKNNRQDLLSCVICLKSTSEDPVVTQCGHIFCWVCLKMWVSNSDKMFCPICKNGINMDRVISLYANSTNKHTDKPKSERLEPVENRSRPGFFYTLYRSFTYSYNMNNDSIQLSNNEVKANRLALLMIIIGMILIILLFL